MILQRNLYLFLVPRRCLDLRRLLRPIFRSFLSLSGTIGRCYLRDLRAILIARTSLCIRVWLLGLDKNLPMHD